MAFTIYIYERDNIIFETLKQRLTHYFPEAFIVNPFEKNSRHKKGISDYVFILYDSKQYKLPEKPSATGCEYIDLYSHDGEISFIDCSRIELLIKNALSNNSTLITNASNGKLSLVLSFAYIDEREAFIKEHFLEPKSSSDRIMRLDLMSGIRMPSIFKTGLHDGSLTELLKEAGNEGFNEETILSYMTYDNLGFLTPGKPLNSDDVFDAPISSIVSLIKTFKKLIGNQDLKAEAVVICEGFKMTDLLKFIKYFDDVHILLPSRMSDENKGIEDYVNSIKRNMSIDSELNVHFIEDYKKEEKNYIYENRNI